MKRFFLLATVAILAFVAIWVRLFYWQVVSHNKFKLLADNQHFYQLELPPVRGEILSTDKTPLVANQTAYLVFAEKRKIEDQKKFVTQIAPILGEEEASVSALLESSPVWIPLKHQVEEQAAQKLRDLKLNGLGLVREDKRFYPESSMAAHLLGFVGKNDKGQPQGYFGLEGFYNKELGG
jgi:cell division protein FtsI/penicillin-binding protein 2